MAKLDGLSVVITGASSGIGRETALAFAREGASLTLGARRGKQLAAVARQCEREGGRAQYLETDVTNALATKSLAQAAARCYGHLDLWVNNAGVGAVGRFTDIPIEAHDQVIRTNLIGYIHGAHAALPYFQAQHHGTLVNVVSFGAFVGTPFGTSYTASKWGLRGLGESLRAELQDEPDIHICDINPGFVDTPGVAHAGNYTGHRFNVTVPDKPQEVADAIVRLAAKPRNSVSVGMTAKLSPIAYALAPGLSRWVMYKMLGTAIARANPQAPSDGALFKPGSNGGLSQPMSITFPKTLVAGLGTAALLGLAAVLTRRRRPDA